MPATYDLAQRRNQVSKAWGLCLAFVVGGIFFAFLMIGGSGGEAQAQGKAVAPQGGTATASPTECAAGFDYVVARSTEATIVPATDRLPIDCRFNCGATIDLPFPFTLYDRTFNSVTVGSNGVLGFVRTSNGYQPSCLPDATSDYAIYPDWELMAYRYSAPDPSRGVFTSVTGVEPNRIFNIEWRARDQFNVSPINVEVRLYENSPTKRFDIIYGAVNHHGGHAVIGVQKDTGSRSTQFSCLARGNVDPGVMLVFEAGECGTPVPPTPTSTRTDTPMPSNTPTITNTPPIVDTPTPTPTTCGIQGNYQVNETTGATIVPGTEDSGLHCSECSTTLALPFSYRFYDMIFDSVKVTSKGTMGFVEATGAYYSDCLPDAYSDYAIFPHWDDLDLSQTCGDGDCGIYTSVSGPAPHRIFNIEWRARYHNMWNTANFEVRLYEGEDRFDMVYGYVTLEGYNATVGAQKGTGDLSVEYSCGGYNLTEGLQLSFTRPACDMTPTPGATSEPTHTAIVPPSATGVPATNTPGQQATATETPGQQTTATPTACTISFSDVPVGSTFYSYTQCLACKGIISGYPDGTFRPNNTVTRGQAAKIISNAAGYEDAIPQTQQTFLDVPNTSTFWVFVERAAAHGAINGYPDNTFRPGNNLTRGQLTKIDAMAANLIESVPPDQQTFVDVPPNSTFWQYVETVAMRGIVSGYECGGPGEPCPGLYFRPGNDLTRGQAAKIVSSTFFPGCATR